MIVSYNASAVKIFNATNSIERFENETYCPYLKKRSSLLQSWRCKFGVVVVNSEVVVYGVSAT
jgi:hypothetical protein